MKTQPLKNNHYLPLKSHKHFRSYLDKLCPHHLCPPFINKLTSLVFLSGVALQDYELPVHKNEFLPQLALNLALKSVT
jgi:hypothetical protein